MSIKHSMLTSSKTTHSCSIEAGSSRSLTSSLMKTIVISASVLILGEWLTRFLSPSERDELAYYWRSKDWRGFCDFSGHVLGLPDRCQEVLCNWYDAAL